MVAHLRACDIVAGIDTTMKKRFDLKPSQSYLSWNWVEFPGGRFIPPVNWMNFT